MLQGERAISYRELDAISDGYAARLTALGVAAGARVCLLLPRSIGCVLLMLAAAKIGAAYVPVDGNLPEEAQRALIESAEVCRPFAALSVTVPPAVLIADVATV